ncbi:MAG: hypothetical protein CMN55_17235 [Sneathiella sp.]|jgi:nitronate monooxygenase|nr:hypothetical protein [Sneathiella sp.]|tara:strand:- start:149 stop:682 length:534 start_codon:yes stop_codon:yes gene_type:complete
MDERTIIMMNTAKPGKIDNDMDQAGIASARLSENAEHDLLANEDILELLNILLEAERAGARAVQVLSKQTRDAVTGETLQEIAVDEGRFCVMLNQHINRLGGRPSKKTGDFFEKLMALEQFDDKLDLLDRGQSWVVRKIRGALARIGDEKLHADLLDMLKVHEINIKSAASLRKADW